ncbi:hypothetical protein V493_00765 [Pseudogymnoascus sp. VKM F-4281 (FW-2241)]|nr:hypothetical protein V493_00765 [Pseudogymnoascus sp. VKM F-4281 (FW-2241)]
MSTSADRPSDGPMADTGVPSGEAVVNSWGWHIHSKITSAGPSDGPVALLCQGRPEVYVTLGTQDNPRNGEKSSERAA